VFDGQRFWPIQPIDWLVPIEVMRGFSDLLHGAEVAADEGDVESGGFKTPDLAD